MPHVDHTRKLQIQLFGASRFHDGATAEPGGELHIGAFSNPFLYAVRHRNILGVWRRSSRQ